ncbi:LysR substrate-binding domain-containing protein [Streptomyces harbinensis]|uniref:LysR substrate-binding domain-containing protein n=1 Tax=Streptomyces harbinensis TaxID=1176198 RepID=UPI003F6A03E9
MTDSEAAPAFRLGYVPGVTPGKWVRIWQERLPDVPLVLSGVTAAEAPGALRADGPEAADAVLLRLPADRDGLSVIPLYTETSVVIVPKDHVVAAADEVTAGDLADDIVLHPLDDTLEWERLPGRPALERPATTADAVELVAAGVGVLVVPQSLARLHHRRDLTYRPVTDAPVSRVGLAWREGRTSDLVEEFIGIVRGRTVNSSRGRQAEEPPRKLSARAKAKARAERRAAAGGAGSGGGGGRGDGGTRPAQPGRLTVDAVSTARGTEITLTASGGAPVQWNAVWSAQWLTLSATSGTLEPGESVTLVVTVDRDREPSGPWQGRITIEPAGATITIEGNGPASPEPSEPPPTEEPAPEPSDPAPSDPPPADPSPTDPV